MINIKLAEERGELATPATEKKLESYTTVD